MCELRWSDGFRLIGRFRAVVAAVITLSAARFALASSNARPAHDDKAKPLFGELKVSAASLSFKEINLSSNLVSESKTFAVTDSGTGDITVTVGTSAGNAAFIVTGGGSIALQPKAHATI